MSHSSWHRGPVVVGGVFVYGINLSEKVSRLEVLTLKYNDLLVSHQKLESDASVLTQKASDYASEIDMLRQKVNSIEILISKDDTGLTAVTTMLTNCQNQVNVLAAKIENLQASTCRADALITANAANTTTVHSELKDIHATLIAARERLASLESAVKKDSTK